MDNREEDDITTTILFSNTMQSNCPFSNNAFLQVCDMLHMFYIQTKDEEKDNSYGVVSNNIFNQPLFGVNRERTGQDARTVSTDMTQINKTTAVGNLVLLMQAREEAHARA